MSESEAHAWFNARYPPAAVNKVGRFLDMVIDENGRQNLIAPSTIPAIWDRHARDSAQLLAFDRPGETWLDIGTGGGFPGMIVAILRDAPVVMIEPRVRRAGFLQTCCAELDLPQARVTCAKVERFQSPVGVISARAVASVAALIGSTRQCAGKSTRWILPKGRSATADVIEAGRQWRGMFHVEQSIVEPTAGIVIVEGVEPR